MAVRHGAWRSLDGLSERDRALCEVAEKLSCRPTEMTAEDWAPLRELGLDDAACLEVAHVVGVFNHLTRLADGFGLQLDPQTLAAAESGVPLRRPSEEA
ncbi:MAG: hypothetical protein QOE06_3110 [Thermoleophilaceae bacterium]|nr:hypothetical protein [Thermoleophilaceae bacterium]